MKTEQKKLKKRRLTVIFGNNKVKRFDIFSKKDHFGRNTVVVKEVEDKNLKFKLKKDLKRLPINLKKILEIIQEGLSCIK